MATLPSASLRARRHSSYLAPAHAVVLAIILYAAPVRRAPGQTEADFKVMHYQESGDRIKVVSPAAMLRYEVSPSLSIKIDGVYDSISGATPTGAPATSSTAASPAATVDSAYAGSVFAVAGATPQPKKSAAATPVAVVATNAPVATGDESVPMAQIDDHRKAFNAEATSRVANHMLSGKVSFSTEDDYQSQGVSIKDGIDFNHRCTTLGLGLAYTHDQIDTFSPAATETRDTVDLLAGVTQVLGPRTQITANYVLSLYSGYLSDPYKVVELNGELMSENRPDDRTRHTFYVALVQGVPAMDAAVEADYRFALDSFGTDAQTVSAAWHQHLGDRWVASPTVRFYDQSAADFYAVRFAGSPEHYSADYRVSELTTWSYGLKLAWFITDRVSVDAAYDRYEMDGQDGVTPSDAYATADAYTVGAKWLF